MGTTAAITPSVFLSLERPGSNSLLKVTGQQRGEKAHSLQAKCLTSLSQLNKMDLFSPHLWNVVILRIMFLCESHTLFS